MSNLFLLLNISFFSNEISSIRVSNIAEPRQNSQNPFSRRFNNTSDYHLDKPPPNYGSKGYSAPSYRDAPPRASLEPPAFRDVPPRTGLEPPVFRDGPTRSSFDTPAFRDGPSRTIYDTPVFRDGPTRPNQEMPAFRDAPPSTGIYNHCYALV